MSEAPAGEGGAEPVARARRSRLAEIHPGLPFLLRFVVFAALFYGFAASSLYVDRLLPGIAGVQATVSGWMLTLFGQQMTVVGRDLSGAGVALSIKEGCDASEATALYVAACLAFPAAWRSRLWAAVAGVAMIFVLNVARVVTLFYVALYARDWFDVAHVDVWPVLILLDCVILWSLWARSAPRPALA
jgi:exosortase H (IPTLxxWG-CTERM-specific)